MTCPVNVALEMLSDGRLQVHRPGGRYVTGCREQDIVFQQIVLSGMLIWTKLESLPAGPKRLRGGAGFTAKIEVNGVVTRWEALIRS